jgi:hypothetical protein
MGGKPHKGVAFLQKGRIARTPAKAGAQSGKARTSQEQLSGA